jgi:hypothetical protein
MNGAGAVHPPGVDIRAAHQQLVDRLELPRHRGPMNRPVGSLVALAEELGLGIEQRAHLLHIMFAQRQRDRLALRRSVELRFERIHQHALHRRIAAVARDLDRVIFNPEIHRVGVVLEQEPCDSNVVLAHREIERLAVVVVGPREHAVFRDQHPHGREVTRRAGLEQRPHVSAPAGGPRELLAGLQLRGLQHAPVRLQRFDAVHQRRPAVEAVLAREPVLCRRLGRRRIGGAQCVKMLLGLLAELLQRRTLRQTPAR